jgi:phosphatidate cytidylyltransferase
VFNSAVVVALIVSGAALALAVPAIFAAERFDVRRVRASVLTARWTSWLVITSVVTAALALGDAVLLTLFALTAAVGAFELTTLLGLRRPESLLSAVVAAGTLIVVATAGVEVSLGVSLVAVVGLSAAHLRTMSHPTSSLLGAIGTVTLAAALASAPRLLSGVETGAALLIAPLLAVSIGDVGAFVAGRTLGGPRLAPVISPAKRWSGLLGNVGGSVVAFAAVSTLLVGGLAQPWLVMALIVPPAAVAGDLLESALKRHAQVKDAGSWLPGFGGLLDRIDSSFLALPVVYATALASTEVLS